MSDSAPASNDMIATLTACAQALYDKKAENLKVLHLGEKSSVADYFILATGMSDPHLRALAIETEKCLDSRGVQILGAERTTKSGWVVVDAGDFMVHIFTREMRGHYNLEGLWKDADLVTLKLT